MTVLTLVKYTDPVLHKEAAEFDFSKPPLDPVLLAKDLAETMAAKSALGLAAPQVGIPYRVFAVASNPVLVMFNPLMVDVSEEKAEFPEGCLSFPGVMIKKMRPKSIKIRYAYPNGEVKTEKYTDLTARIILHEYDHIAGVTFMDDLSKLKKDMAFKKANKLMREDYYRTTL